jgi:hypothetical protein
MGRSPHDDLRLAIELLPERTRRAMLIGVRSNAIVVGAYTHDGGICPMLAAHRNGGRTDFISFAKAWDRFTRVKKQPRRATERELRILETMLEASLMPETEFDGVIAEHQSLARRRRAREARQTGFGWLRRREKRVEEPEPELV